MFERFQEGFKAQVKLIGLICRRRESTMIEDEDEIMEMNDEWYGERAYERSVWRILGLSVWIGGIFLQVKLMWWFYDQDGLIEILL